jgi:hypothetical protein
MIGSGKFAIGLTLYSLISLAIFLSAAFTGAAWIVYGLVLMPFYLCCVVYAISLYLKYPHGKIGFANSFWYTIVGSQLFVILTSPADCRGWHQGNTCYSFIQTYIDSSPVRSHWTTVENLFPIALLSYLIAITFYLRNIKIARS